MTAERHASGDGGGVSLYMQAQGVLANPETNLPVATAYAFGFVFVPLLKYGQSVVPGNEPDQEGVEETVDEQSEQSTS